jgi:ABC-2 type transport system ATP-binding protein
VAKLAARGIGLVLVDRPPSALVAAADVAKLEVVKSIPVGSFPWASPRGIPSGHRDRAAMTSPTQQPGPLAALEVSGVSHHYGKRLALDHVSLCVAASSFTALLGLNGAGKTTLFSLVTRLFAARSGHIHVLGFDLADAPSEALRRMGVVFQARTLDLDLSIAQNLAYHAALHGLFPREARARAADVLDRFELADRVSDKVRNLSGGEMRRVEIARALLHRPRLLLLDEPTVGLDIKARADLLAHVRGLVASEGVGVLWATHLIDEIDPGDAVVVLHKGVVRDHGPVAGVVSRAGAQDVGEAFRKLTGFATPEGART